MEDSLVARARDLDAREVRFARGGLTGVIVADDGPGLPADDHGVISPYPHGDADRETPWLWRAAAVIVVGGGALLSRARHSAVPALSAATIAVGFTVYSVGLPEVRPYQAPSVAGPRAPGRDTAFLAGEAGDAPTKQPPRTTAARPAGRTPRPAAVTAPAPTNRIRLGNSTAGADLAPPETDDNRVQKIERYASDCATGERQLDPGHVDAGPGGVDVKLPVLRCSGSEGVGPE